jgi:hypothetical protein
MTENAIDTKQATARREYIAGLRNLALLLEEREDLPLPHTGNRAVSLIGGPLDIFNTDEAVLELLMAHVGRPAEVKMLALTAWITWHLDGVALRINLPVKQVFDRVVTSTYRVGDESFESAEWVLAERFQPATGGAA